MSNYIKSRWLKFVLRTLADWVAFILFIIIIDIVRDIMAPPRCTYDFDQREFDAKQTILENFVINVDTINGERYYIAVDTVHHYKFSTGIHPY